MLKTPFSLFTYLIFATLLFYSCTDDIEDSIVEDFAQNSSAAANAGPPNNQQNNNGPNGDRDRDPESLNTDVILAWSNLFIELDRYAEGMRPNASARALAYVHLAGYEVAVPAMRDFISNEGRIPGFRINGQPDPRNLDVNIALNVAYARVTNHFLINLPDYQREEIELLESELSASLSNNVNRRTVDKSVNWGRSVARQVIQYAQTDRRAEAQIQDPQPTSYIPPTREGYWTFSAEPERALFPYWGNTRTFVISAEETSTVPPPHNYSEDVSSNYYKEMEEVYHANNDARSEDGEQLWIAEFWSDDVTGNTFGPPVRQLSIANQIMVQYDMKMAESLALLLKLGFALNDAAVSTWADKYEYMVMRPSVYIQDFIDPTYQTNLYRLIPWPNPTFPGYPSGHSCFASAAAGVFIDFVGNETSFTDRSHEGRTEFRGAPRTFNSFEDMAEENAYSRIPLGVHIRMDCSEGLRLGYEISDAVNQYRLKRPGA